MKTITRIEPSKRSENKKLKVAAYCRVSTSSDEQLESLETQKKHYDSYIKEHDDWEYAGLYYDEGITGTKTEGRAGLQKMLDDCRLGKIDFILTKSISRFSRNKIDCLTMVRELLGLGIGIFFEKENINTKTMNDEFLLTILSSIAETESQSISLNEKWGIQARMKAGTYHQATPPYGYVFNKEKQYVIDEEKAEVVRYIYRQTLNGLGCHKIMKKLNEKGIPSPRGGRWSTSIVSDILTNERYCGHCLYGKTYTDSTFRRHYNNGESDRIFIKNHHAAIISEEDFNRVQEIRSKRRMDKKIESGTDVYKARYPFTHKLKCGQCGHYLKHVLIKTGVSGTYDAWKCEGHIKDKNSCSLKAIPQEAIENAFTTMLNKLIFSKKQLLVPFCQTLKDSDEGKEGKRLEEIEKELAENADKNETIAKLAASGVLDAQNFLNAQAELKAKRQDLMAEKSMLTLRIAEGYRNDTEADKLLKLVDHLEPSEKFNADIFGQIVDEITVHSRESISIKLKCGLVLDEEVKLK